MNIRRQQSNLLGLWLITLNALIFSACAQPKQQNIMTTNHSSLDSIYLGAGCFWCVESIFQRLEGVQSAVSGYGGGHIENPTYQQVCAKNTGHAELIKLVYDPAKISLDEILEVYWKTHNPTTINRQGEDVGPQYRSVIFYTNEQQKTTAENYKKNLDAAKVWDAPIVTAIEPFKNFYPAEDYHQNYYNLNGNQPYCRMVIQPKIEKFEKVFKDKLKPKN